MPIDLDSTVVRVEGAISTLLDEEIVILNMAKNNYIALNAIGRRIWDLIEGPILVGDLNLALSREFETSLEQVAADVIPFLNRLEGEGLLDVTSGGSK